MTFPPRRRSAALAAVAYLAAASIPLAPALAQGPQQPPPLDPESPLDPMPGLGVDWPDLNAAPNAPVAAQRTEAATELRYTIRFEGLSDAQAEALHKQFDALSTLKAGEGKPANAAQLDRRAREDATLLTELLRSEGYYDAAVDPRVSPSGGALVVTLDAEPGQLYRFREVDLRGLEKTGAKADALRAAFGIKPDDPVDAAKVQAGEAALRVKIGQEGFPFAKIGEPQVTVDHESRTATLALDIDPGGSRKFGRIVTPKGALFNANHIQEIARFKPGQPFEASDLDDLRRALVATGLVSSVKIQPIEGATPGTVDLSVQTSPAPPRTIAGELGYGTGEGVRAEVSWQHRNLFPPEGGLTVRAVAGTQEQLFALDYRRNNFHARDRVLTGTFSASHVQRPGYEAKTLQLGAAIERQTNIIFQKKWTWSIGPEFLASDERDTVGPLATPRRRTFLIAALPGTLSYDGTDDLLNPTRGFRLAGRLSPELSLQAGAFGYARLQIDGSAYQPVGDRVVLAERIRLGSIAGASADRIAPSRRFYAGGGGSVRGYSYQAIGPRDGNNDPVGGTSLAEFGLEARVRFGNFGIVPFLDGGNIYRSTLPTFGGLRYGAGLGVRYYTSFGPIRVDVGTPLNPQPGDPRVGVYVSLGQAF